MTTTSTQLQELGSSEVLDAVVERRRAADRAEAELLGLAVHWVDLHPVTGQNPAASPGPDGPLFADEPPLAGAGTPGIAEFAVEELSAALGLSYHAGLRLVSEAVELSHRLPRIWALVQDGHLQAWKARQVARETARLSRDSVEFVDRHVATTGRRNRVPALNPLLHEARLQCDPDQALAVEQLALDARGVWFDHRESTATTQVSARLDTLDALDLESSVGDLAGVLGRLGDTRPVDIRRAGALGMLAHPQRALDFVHGVGGGEPEETSTLSAQLGTGSNGSPGTLYLHITSADLAAHLETGAGGGTVEKLGPATMQLLRDWLQRLSSVSVRPVLDLRRPDAVDSHDPPAWMRETVVLRDGHCVFPACTIDARRCDLDHISAYVSPDDGGPPGQTSPDNLACLCRRHHRLKTFTGWTYERLEHNRFEWTAPRGHRYVVTTGHRATGSGWWEGQVVGTQ